MQSAEEITKKAKSNLAFALVCLPKDRRLDMVRFYAFCRVIDDIADDVTVEERVRHEQLDRWQKILSSRKPTSPDDSIQTGILDLINRYQIDVTHLTELIEGCRSDIPNNQRFASWEELSTYTHRVACCVGLVSIKIFGCTHPDSAKYAVKLGHALQLTNIIRDVGHDLKNGHRIYLPLNDMIRFQYSERDLIGKVHDGRFIAMLNYHAERAESMYQEAETLVHSTDAKALKASESMRKIYTSILKKMKRDNFQVFQKYYTLSKAKKLYYLFS